MQKRRAHHIIMRPAVFCLILGTLPLALGASTLDPRISVGDPSSGTVLLSGTFSFESNANGGGLLNFINDSGNTWTTLDFFVTLPSSDTITCSSTLYRLCNYTEASPGDGKSLFDIGFEEPYEAGIASGSAFSIDLNDSVRENMGSWGPNVTMNAIGNFDIPEPASLRLALTALFMWFLLVTYRRVSG